MHCACQSAGSEWQVLRPLVGDLTVLKDGHRGRVERLHATAQARADHASEYVAGAACRQAAIAGGVHDRNVLRRGGNGARALEYHGALKLLRQGLCRGQPVALNVGSVST